LATPGRRSSPHMHLQVERRKPQQRKDLETPTRGVGRQGTESKAAFPAAASAPQDQHSEHRG